MISSFYFYDGPKRWFSNNVQIQFITDELKLTLPQFISNFSSNAFLNTLDNQNLIFLLLIIHFEFVIQFFCVCVQNQEKVKLLILIRLSTYIEESRLRPLRSLKPLNLSFSLSLSFHSLSFSFSLSIFLSLFLSLFLSHIQTISLS